MHEIAASFPILSILVFFPAAGALLIIFFAKKEQFDLIRWSALGFALAEFALSLYLPFTFDSSNPGMQWVERGAWIERFGMNYILGVDGISLLLVLLTTLVTIICVLASWRDVKDKLKWFMALLLFTETCSLGVFMAMDLFLFYIFWEAVLIPMVFIIGIWGGARKLYSAVKFFVFTFVGSLFMLLGVLVLYFYHGHATGVYTFDVAVLFQNPVAPAVQFWIFMAFFLGFAVKVPMFPVHTWLPDAHTEAPTAGSIILAAVLLKLGSYGFLRFSLPLLPNASVQFAPLMMGISIFAIIYGALVTIAQKDMKKVVAYSSVSHMGFVMLGMFALNIEGIRGGLMQMINHGISTGALFLLVGMIYERTHTRTIGDYTGLFKVMPVFGVFFLITVLSSMGLPSTNGFIGELFILIGAFKAYPLYAVIAVVGVLLGAVYLLWLFQRVFLGDFVYRGKEELKDLKAREIISGGTLMVLIFWIGLCPKPFIRSMEASVNQVVRLVDTNYKKGLALAQASTPAASPSPTDASAAVVPAPGQPARDAAAQQAQAPAAAK
ncbi:MAG: NADH-quinone oxidoreductase subunit M [Deltaproteobacteria bacterium]|nr:NADH-quinone oxidoreductase subunit M [Deltaproteobacteria bacterium]